MIETIDVFNFLSYITIGIMYILLIDLKYSMKNSLIAFSVFTVTSFGTVILLSANDLLPAFFNTAFLAIPAAIFSIFLAKYKDSRFVFTLFTVDTLGLIIFICARVLTLLFVSYSILIIIITVIIYATILYFVFKHRKIYINIQNQIKISWCSLAYFSIIAYLVLTILISFPTPLKTRIDEFPASFLISLFIAFAYIIIYRVFAREIEIYNEKKEKTILELDDKYQKSQLELNKLYYKYAYEDEVTRLKNRRAFEEAKAKDLSKDTICLTLDINNLKEINDQSGHKHGDKALKILSDALRRTFVGHDNIYRIGGDEFVVLLNMEDIDEIKPTIKKLYQHLGECSKESHCDVSVAIGYSSYQTDRVSSFDELYNLADQRMYIDKAKYKHS